MKRFLLAFFSSALVAAALAALVASLASRHARVETAAPLPRTETAEEMVAASAISSSPTPAGESSAARLERWLALAATVEGLPAVDEEIRRLPAEAFPAICDEAYGIADPAPTSLLRLLCLHWAEHDGAAALEWARDRFRIANKEDWREWLNDIAGVWFATRPDEAGAWFSEIMATRETRESWAPLGGHIPLESWARPGNVVALAKAKLAQFTPGSSLSENSSIATMFSRQVTTLEEIQELRALADSWIKRWPRRERLPSGEVRVRDGGDPGLTIATIYEQAWPRIDPEGWRRYAEEKVIGAQGNHLLAELVTADCQTTADPAALAREFLLSPQATLTNGADVWKLLQAVEEREPGAGWELVREGTAPVENSAAIRFATDRHPGNLAAVMADLESLPDPALRHRATEQRLLTWPGKHGDVDDWLATSGWPEDRIDAFREMSFSSAIR